MLTCFICDSQLDMYSKCATCWDELAARNAELLAALKGVVRVADRATDEFDAARAAIARSEEK